MTSVREVVGAASAQLRAAGIAGADVDAEWLLAYLLAESRGGLAAVESVDTSTLAAYAELVRRRAAREPLQHIVGTAPFRYLELAVGSGVFVPRPETELLVGAVLPHLRTVTAPRVVDLCAGSGALGLAIADEVPGARVIAVEYAPAALAWLHLNAGRRIEVLSGNVRDPELLRPERGAVDAVVSNPPYVPSATEVEPEVHADPADAVFAGPDGLALIPAVISRAAELLRPGGMLALEHSDTHARDVPRLLAAAGVWADIADHNDLSGRPRYATARRVATRGTAG